MRKLYGLNIVAGGLYTKYFTLENQSMARPLRIWGFLSVVDIEFTVFQM